MLTTYANIFAQVDSSTSKSIRYEVIDSAKSIENKFSVPDSILIFEETYFEDPTRNELLFAPTAKNLKSGNGVLGVRNFFLPYTSLGISNRISIGTTGFILPVPFSPLFYLVSTQINIYSTTNFDAATGVYYLINLHNNESMPYFYGVTTYSNSKYLLNIGAGFGAIKSDYFVFVGGEYRYDETSKLITDNWFLTNGTTIFTFAGRNFSKKYFFDLGLMLILHNKRISPGGIISFAHHF
jgi:hypothetical protein